jgi:hypothetical protein
MAHVEFHSGAPRHPKIAPISDAAFRLWFNSVCYCKEHLTDGLLPKILVRTLKARVTAAQIQELTTVQPSCKFPLWEDAGDAYQVHDFCYWNDTKDEVQKNREGQKDRSRRFRERLAAARALEAATTGVVTTEALDEETPEGLQPPDAPIGGELPRDVTPSPNASGDASRHALHNALRTQGTRYPVPGTRISVPGTRYSGFGDGAPLGLRGRVDVAWPGRPPVPGMLHAEFRQKLGGEPDEAEAKLRAWYPTVAAVWADRAIGDTDWNFWRARFREWVGTTVTTGPDKPAQRKAATQAFLERQRGRA